MCVYFLNHFFWWVYSFCFLFFLLWFLWWLVVLWVCCFYWLLVGFFLGFTWRFPVFGRCFVCFCRRFYKGKLTNMFLTKGNYGNLMVYSDFTVFFEVHGIC